MLSRLAVLGVLVTLAAPASAGASKWVVDSNPVKVAITRAVEYWGSVPCGGRVTVVPGTRSEAPASGMHSDGTPGEVAAMWATWISLGGGKTVFTSPPSTFTRCVVHIDLAVWPSWRVDDHYFPAFCKEMLHEYGHFRGYSDTGATPGTIQYERPDLAHVPLCERYRLVYGHTIYESRRRSGPRRPRLS